ncbi:type IV secretion system protein [Yersinia pestis]|uniref:Inner membrane protein of type IV secretion n=1 Tax=Yersinia pestis subsp. pestis bv. Medievalis TaxID=1234662 RepID=A0A096ZX89_YERPE|nr:type IV secretion system protein [Yersinia pestis]AIS36183.1 inner membrane protein of type IV secretion [Yersinia pestis subsp. pestis bv. Medievalis]KAA5809387.1 type IV secretion system protein [Yersinia pestis]NSL64644.1 type IV secretion system protein [Yersinia pestis]QFR87657.1 conjugal transfer protein [Yersinia pestis subsp. pestis bv. Medievalis]TNV44388.1 type IV secretion system protein [Yersinia pestis]
MSDSSSPGIFVGFEKNIMGGFREVLEGTTSTYGVLMASIFTACFTSYFIWRGYQTLAGKLQKPIEETLWEAVKMIIIMMFVTNGNGYLDMVTMAINGLRDGITGNESIWALLDTTWDKAQKLGSTLYEKDEDWIPLNGFSAELVVWIGVAALVLVSAFVNLIAEFILLLMLTTAPIFIFCLMWGWLRSTFNNWLQTIISCILAALFCGLSLQVIMNYMDLILPAALISSETVNMVTLGFQVGVVAILGALVVLVAYKLATALAGVAAMGAIQSVASSALFKGFSAGGQAAKAVGSQAAKGLGKVGEMAAQNLRSTPSLSGGKSSSQQASDSRKASIQTMKRINSLRK